jgi:uncharacterized protein (TIGR03083 family)
MKSQVKIETLHLFQVLDEKLTELLISLNEDDWSAQTVAKLWTVKDVAAHLLDGNLRGLSTSRDGYFGVKPERIDSYQDLVAYLNQLNLSWTKVAKRLSPKVLIDLLKTTGAEYREHLKSLNPNEDALFSVAWAGQESSPNWFHIAREYTEKFLHQQQIRDAVGKQGIMTKELFYPFLDIMMYAFPHTFRNISAESGTVVSLRITTEIGGLWSIIKTDHNWTLTKAENLNANSQLIIDPNSAWKLFSKSWSPELVIDEVEILGERTFAEQALKIVAVMA